MPSNSNRGRVWLEAPVIVVSILLAFGIEAGWAGLVEAREGRSIETQYYGQLEPFLVANTIYSEIAAEWWRDSLVEAPFKTDFAALTENRELWNLLTLRLEAEVALQSRLDRLDEMADALLLVLPEDS